MHINKPLTKVVGQSSQEQSGSSPSTPWTRVRDKYINPLLGRYAPATATAVAALLAMYGWKRKNKTFFTFFNKLGVVTGVAASTYMFTKKVTNNEWGVAFPGIKSSPVGQSIDNASSTAGLTSGTSKRFGYKTISSLTLPKLPTTGQSSLTPIPVKDVGRLFNENLPSASTFDFWRDVIGTGVIVWGSLFSLGLIGKGLFHWWRLDQHFNNLEDLTEGELGFVRFETLSHKEQISILEWMLRDIERLKNGRNLQGYTIQEMNVPIQQRIRAFESLQEYIYQLLQQVKVRRAKVQQEQLNVSMLQMLKILDKKGNEYVDTRNAPLIKNVGHTLAELADLVLLASSEDWLDLTKDGKIRKALQFLEPAWNDPKVMYTAKRPIEALNAPLELPANDFGRVVEWGDRRLRFNRGVYADTYQYLNGIDWGALYDATEHWLVQEAQQLKTTWSEADLLEPPITQLGADAPKKVQIVNS